MTPRRASSQHIALGALGALGAVLAAPVAVVAAAPLPQAAPEVLKVEPPSWWPGHSINPVRLLLRGRNLAGATVEAQGDGIGVGLVRANAAGSYLFVDVSIDADARPGPRRLLVRTPLGHAEAAFELEAPLSREGRFQGFSRDDVIYLIMPDRFANGDPTNDDPAVSRGLLDRGRGRHYHGGDLQGIIDRLPYLSDLGVTTLWLNPWYDNVNHPNQKEQYGEGPITDYHGYGAVDFYAVEERLGTLAKLRELVEAAHRRGLKVIQDQVANHTGPYHPWVTDPPTPTWFSGSAERHLANTWQTWTLADPYARPVTQEATLRGWFIDILPDLDQDDEEVRRYLIQNTLWWVGVTGLDGIRQDTLPYVPRRFWRDWMAAIKREYPRLTVVGELLDGDPTLVSFYQGGATGFDGVDSGIDSLFDFPLFYPLRRAFAEGKPILELAQMLARDRLYPRPAELVTLLGLHDVRRFMDEPGATVAGLELAFTFLLTARGIPLVYYGDEIAMPGGVDPDNRRDFPGGWPGDPRNAFEAGGRTTDEQSVFERVRTLTRLRAGLVPLRQGATATLLAQEQAYVFARATRDDAAIVALNNAGAAATLDVPVRGLGLGEGATLEDRLSGIAALQVAGGRLRFTLPARSAALLVRRR
jgi:glycosidase